MSESPQAVFVSYASQDADAARHLCDTLRAAGVQVWFDQNELRGGEAWDASIRKKIKECALFVPIISTNTQAREEGYFRREWNIAVNRTLDMSDDKAFVLPVVIDGTGDLGARVPEKFRSVQWTRAPGGQGAEAFAGRVRHLLGGAMPAPVAAAQAPARESEAPSIAVLPFVNLSRDEENEYFADGLAEELLNVLAKIRGLRVASRTSAFSFKGKDVDIPTIAQKLGVATILEGSVRKAGNRVRITAQLIEVANDSHLWSGTYDRTLDDIFAVQDDIAQSVVQELRAALLHEVPAKEAEAAAADVRAAATGRSHNTEAFQLYLQGKFLSERVTQADTDRAIALLEQALVIDPAFALAWTELSRIHELQAGFGFAPIAQGYERARKAAQQALRIAPDLAEAYVQLGNVLMQSEWDWVAAEASLRRALELAPGSANALSSAAVLTRILGRLEEGVELMRKAIALDPLSMRVHRQAAVLYFMSEVTDEAEASFKFSLELNPHAGLNHALLAILRLQQGRQDEALSLAQAEVHDVFRNVALAFIHHAAGRAAESDAALKSLIEDSGWTAAYQVAEVYCYRGEIEQAFEWLERAYEQRDPGTPFLLTDIFLRPLHADPRWSQMLKKMRLAD